MSFFLTVEAQVVSLGSFFVIDGLLVFLLVSVARNLHDEPRPV
jgi:hypothetical protein